MSSSHKIALVADWMTVQGGAEKVLESLHHMYPNADFFTTVFIPESFPTIDPNRVHTTWLQHLPRFLKKRHQVLYPFLMTAIETLDLTGYDIVISSASFVAKGVIVPESALHICYCHTPTRYFWDEWQYFLREGLNIPVFLRPFKRLFPFLFTSHRLWDFVAAQRPDIMIGNSEYVVRRIAKYYRRDAFLLRPPVDYDRFVRGLESPKSDFFVAVGRLIPYKKFDLLIQAFAMMPDKKLKIAGRGPEIDALVSLAAGHTNIEFLGFVSDDDLPSLLGSARAFLFPQNEDAGIAPMEALCTGTPCIAFCKGGSVGMVTQENGIFFAEQTPESIVDAVRRFELCEDGFVHNREKISAQMEQYSTEQFEKKLGEIVEMAMQD